MGSGRLIAIGDIHGHAPALASLLEQIQPQTDDTLVTLGDYVNRGPHSRDVLDTLIALADRCRLIPILGNHEEMMLSSRDDVHAEGRWRWQGGDATLASYGPDAGIGQIPQSHWSFLAGCQPYHETDQFVFTHANYLWHTPWPQQPESLLRWLSLEEAPPSPHLSGNTVILGHTPGPVRDEGFYRCIDTGCGFGGLLTAMNVITGELWQVDENGERNTQPGLPSA